MKRFRTLSLEEHAHRRLIRRLRTGVAEDLPESVGADPSAEPPYVIQLVEHVVDCVDTRRSAKPKKAMGQMKTTVFRPDALPSHLLAFRVPEFPGGVHWNGWAVRCLTDLLGDDLEARLIWSEDRKLAPHPAPWGF